MPDADRMPNGPALMDAMQAGSTTGWRRQFCAWRTAGYSETVISGLAAIYLDPLLLLNVLGDPDGRWWAEALNTRYGVDARSLRPTWTETRKAWWPQTGGLRLTKSSPRWGFLHPATPKPPPPPRRPRQSARGRRRPARVGDLSARADFVVATRVATAEVVQRVVRLAEEHRVTRGYVTAVALAYGLPAYRRQEERRPPQSRPARAGTLSAHVPAALAKEIKATAKACTSSQSVVVAGAVARGLSDAKAALEVEQKPRGTAGGTGQ